MSPESPQPDDFLLPLPGWLCRMSKDYDFEEVPGFAPEIWQQEGIGPPYIFIWRDRLQQAGQGEGLLLAHKRVKACWEAWEIHEARFRLRVSKRVVVEINSYVHLAVYTSRTAALADAAENYAGNRLLLDLARDERPQIRGAAEAVLAGTEDVTALAAAAEATADSRAATIRQLRLLPK